MSKILRKLDAQKARWRARGGKTVDESGRELSDAEWESRFREAQRGGRPFKWKTVHPPTYCRICQGPHKPKHGRP